MLNNLISHLNIPGKSVWGLLNEEERNYWTNQAWGWFHENMRRVMFLGTFSQREQARIIEGVACSFRLQKRNYDSFYETLENPAETWGLDENPYAHQNRPYWLEGDSGCS